MKWFLGLNKNTPDVILYTLIQVDFHEWAATEQRKAKMKWEARMSRSFVSDLPNYSIKCNTKWIPKEVATFINLQNHLCGVCGVRLSQSHLKLHGVVIPSIDELLCRLNQTSSDMRLNKGMQEKRKTILQALSIIVNPYIDAIKEFITNCRDLAV